MKYKKNMCIVKCINCCNIVGHYLCFTSYINNYIINNKEIKCVLCRHNYKYEMNEIKNIYNS